MCIYINIYIICKIQIEYMQSIYIWVGKSLTTRRLNGGSGAFTLPFCHGPGNTCSCIQTGGETF